MAIGESKKHKTGGVMNDPLGQPTVPAGSASRLILKFSDGRTDRPTDRNTLDGQPVWKVITTGRDCDWPRGSIVLESRFLQYNVVEVGRGLY